MFKFVQDSRTAVVVLLGGLVWGTFSFWGMAQDDKAPVAKPEASTPDEPKTAPRTLLLVVEFDDARSPKEFGLLLEDGKKRLNADAQKEGGDQPKVCDFGEVKYRAIDHDIMQAIRGILPGESTAPTVSTGQVRVSELVDETDQSTRVWELKMQSPFEILTQLEVQFAKEESATETEPQVFKPKNAEDPQAQLIRVVAGEYMLRLKDKRPLAYTADVINVKTDQKSQHQGQWPEPSRLFMFSLPEFIGDEKPLFEIIKTERVPTPIKTLDINTNLELLFGSVRGSGFQFKEREELDERNYVASISSITKTSKRVWMLFPLDQNEAKAQYNNLTQGKEAKNSVELSKMIRDQSPWEIDAKADDVFQLKPGVKPRWIELSPDQGGEGFQRKIPVQDLPNFLKDMPEVWRLVVWEFDDGVNVKAQLLDDGPHKQKPVVQKPIKIFSTKRKELGYETSKPSTDTP